VHAWDLPQALDPKRVDLARYRTLLLRAAGSVLQPLGVDEQQVRFWVDEVEAQVEERPERNFLARGRVSPERIARYISDQQLVREDEKLPKIKEFQYLAQ
jgi:hypothetical protein